MDAPAPKLSELLRHPDDLDRISTLKQDFFRKKDAVDGQLRSGLREQLEATQAGMTGLTDGQKIVQQIKDEMMTIDKLCSESQVMIKDFTAINLVSQAHRNFGAVETLRQNLESFNERLTLVERMLTLDDADMENMPNLLPCHYELTQLRNIRDDAMEQIRRADDQSLQETLEDYFQRLDDMIDWFDEHIGLIAINLVNLVIEENNGLVVRFAVIMEAEEKSDQRVLALQDALRDHKEMAARFQSITDGAKTVRGYKEKFTEAIKLGAQPKFEETREAFLTDPTRLEKSFKWYFNALNAVKIGMAPLVPAKWKILKTYGFIYHELMHDFLVELIDDPEGSSAQNLEIVGWPEKYYKKMTKLGFRADELQPHVLDNREGDLVKDFQQLIIKFLDEWLARIFALDSASFADRNAEGSNLDQDEYGYFRTKNLVDMWRMLREQVEAAANSERTDVVEGVIDAMYARLRARQQAWQAMLQGEAARYEAGKVPDLDGFQALQDWLVATANDQIACIDDNEDEGRFAYLTKFQRQYQPAISKGYLEQANAEAAQLRDDYVDFSTWCITKFVNLIFAVDFKSVTVDIFTGKWYAATSLKQMAVTFDEYVGDYRQVLHHSIVDIFIEIFSDELLIRYLGSVRNKGAKFRRADPFQAKMIDDISAVFDVFDSIAATLNNPDLAEGLKATWRVTEFFLDLLLCDKASVAATFAAFKEAFWDLQIGWVEAVLRARDDFERAMLNAVKAQAAQMEVERGPETIMAKVK